MSRDNNTEKQFSGEFSNRPRKKVKVEIPAEVVVEDTVTDTEVVSEDPVEEITVPETEWREDNRTNNFLVAIIFVLLLAIFLQWYQSYCKQDSSNPDPQDEPEVVIDSKYEELQNVVKDYVAKMKDPNKVQLANKISEVYVKASTSPEDINIIESNILKETQEILGFNEPSYSSKTDYEYEWQKLFDATGVVNTWLTNAGLIITKDNQKDVFMAIAKGLK